MRCMLCCCCSRPAADTEFQSSSIATRGLHAAAYTRKQREGAAGAVGCKDPQKALDALPGRLDQLMGPGEPHDHVIVEPAEPGKLKQLGPGQIEDEGHDPEAHHLGEEEHGHGSQPESMRQHPEPDDLERQQNDHRDQEHQERRIGRQPLDRSRNVGLECRPRDARNHPADNRRKTSPQPRLEQKYEREQNEERVEQSAHHCSVATMLAAGPVFQAGRLNITLSRRQRHRLAGAQAVVISHIWIDLLPTARAASFTASVKVGWAWQVRAMSSAAAPNSIATAASAIMLPASGPMIWTPSTRSVLASARIFTKPSVCMLTLARPLAVNGNFPVL